MAVDRLTIAWISDFPIEWLPDSPEGLCLLPRRHPLTWQRVLLGELEQCSELKLHIIVLRKGIPRNFCFERQGVTFHVLKLPRIVRPASFFWSDTLIVRAALRQIRPEVVHAWGTEKGAGLVASRLGFPYLLTMQGLLGWYGEVIRLPAYERLMALFEHYTLGRARNVTTESRFGVQYLKTHYPQLEVEQIEHAPNWLFHQVRREPQTAPFRFISVGTFDHRKGTDLLLKALDGLVGEFAFQLILIGGNAKSAFLNALKSGLLPELWGRLEIKVDLTPSEVARELARATLLVFPTRADTSPNAVKEAVVAGLPVVASEIGGIPDYVYPGQNGFLFRSGSLEELKRALKSACQHPLFKRGLVNEDRLMKTRDYLSPKRMAQRFVDLYRRMARLSAGTLRSRDTAMVP